MDKSLAIKLNTWYDKICTPDFIPLDPVQFPRRYAKREDIEIAAFLSATIAWGRRDMILRSCEKMFAILGKSPYDFIMLGDFKKLKDKNIHRTFFEDDLKYFCKGFNHIYAKYDNIEKLFASGGTVNVWEGFALLREEFAKANRNRYSKHISNPFTTKSRVTTSSKDAENSNGSACKRLNLALRWLVRKGKVDLGLWKSVKPADLYIPLDVHVARTARKLNLIERNANDKRTVIELTEKLREFCADDPVKYDFALFGMGVGG